MFIKYLWFYCMFWILNTQIVAQMTITKPRVQGSRLIPTAFLPGRIKRPIQREIKNHIDRTLQPQSRISPMQRSRRQHHNWPRTPAVYLEPPKLIKYLPKNAKLKNRKQYRKKENNSLESKPENPIDNPPTYVRDHAPIQKEDHKEFTDAKVKNQEKKENSEENDAVQFHVHGHHGPDSYIFGYDTGKGRNRQFRLEERHENGTVTGHYGYYDARGKLRKINYSSKPSNGFQAIPNSHTDGQQDN